MSAVDALMRLVRRLAILAALVLVAWLVGAAGAVAAPSGSDDVFVALSDGSQFLGVGARWHDYFCTRDEICATGDVNGDGKDDIIAFVRTSNLTNDSDVWVALSDGTRFGPSQKWHDYFCTLQEVCAVGDVNGDGKDDIIAFVRTNSGANDSDVYVALSTGTGFGPGQKWHDYFCTLQEVCAVGDVNGDGKADIIAFVRTNHGSNDSDVWVALSDGTRFGPGQKWHDHFCTLQEVCAVGDVNGDGKADILAFVRTNSGANDSDVYVAFSDGTRFGPGQKWHDYFCTLQEVCAVGDVNGDRKADILAFVRTNSGANDSDVYVALSDGTGFGAGQKWHDYFCTLQEICRVGDFNGDGKSDVAAFVRTLVEPPVSNQPEFLSQHPDLRPYIGDASSFIVGGGYLYWSSCTVVGPRGMAPDSAPERAPNAPTAGYLRRWPTSGGRVITLTETFDCANTYWVADEAGLYYWSAGFVMRRSTADPFTPYYVMFAQNQSAPKSALLLDATHVYWLGLNGWVMRAPKLGVIQPDDPRYRDDREDVGFIGPTAYSLMLGSDSRLFWFADNTLFGFRTDCAAVCTPTNYGAEAGGAHLTNATLDNPVLLGSWTYPLWVRGSSVRGRYCRPAPPLLLQCTFGSEYTAPATGGNTYLVGRLAASPTHLFWVENYQICVPGGFCTLSSEGQLMAWPLDLSSDPYPIAARNSGGATFFIRDLGDDTQAERDWVYFRTSEGIARLRTTAPPVQPDLAVYAIEVTQGIQNLTVFGDPARQMDAPLVAYKPTVVRVYGRTLGGPRANNVTARLRVDRHDGPPVSIDLRPDNGALAFPLPGGASLPDRSQLNQSWQFTLPYGWTRWGDYTLTAIVNNSRLNAEPSPANNQGSVRIHFNRKAPICIVFIPIRTAQAGDVFAPPLRPQLDFSVAHAERLLPSEGIRAGWRQSDIAELQARFGIPPWEYGPYELEDDSTKILMSLWLRDQFSDDPDECDNANAETHYVGVAHPNAGGNNGSSWSGHNQMWFRLPNTSTWTDARAPTLAHELGHNYERDHVNCPVGDPEDLDGNYPFPTCQLDYDNNGDRHWGLLNLGGALRTIAPTAAGDLMSYAHKLPTPLPRVTSSYTWHGLFHAIPDGLTAAKPTQARGATPDAPKLAAATGVVLLTGAVNVQTPTQSELSHAWVWPTASVSRRMVDKWQRAAARDWARLAPAAKAAAPYHVRLLDAAGSSWMTAR